MLIRNKYFPYPVVAKGNDSYATAIFSSDAIIEKVGYQIKFTLKGNINNSELNELIKAEKALIVHHIECVQTCYRHAVSTDDSETTFLIHENKLNGVVQITTVIVANENIIGYKNSDFSSDYKGFSFNIKRGCLLAIGDCVEIELNKQKDDLKNAASIFSIIPNLDPNETTIIVDASSVNTKIKISIPEKGCSIYKNLGANLEIQPIMHSMIILPALIQVFEELKIAELYNYDNCKWFKALNKACKENLQLELDEQGIQNLDSYKTAQLLMDSPTIRALEYLAGGSDDEN